MPSDSLALRLWESQLPVYNIAEFQHFHQSEMSHNWAKTCLAGPNVQKLFQNQLDIANSNQQ